MDPSWQPMSSFGGLILQCHAKILKRCREVLLEADLGHISTERLLVLNALFDDEMTQVALSRALSRRAPSVLEILDNLRRAGMVKCRPDASDSRRKLWSLSAKGRRDYLRAKRSFRKIGNEMDHFFLARHIAPGEIERVKSILSSVNQEFFHP